MYQPITYEEAIDLLKKAGCSSAVVKHCRAVSNLAVKLTLKIKKKGTKIDLELVRIGGLLHDIGRSKTHEINHAVIGADMMRSLNLPISIIHIVEKHIGSGIPPIEAVRLGLPKRDFIPETIEEKIVSYADKLIEGDREVSFEEALKKLTGEFGESHGVVNRFKSIHAELFQGLESSRRPC